MPVAGQFASRSASAPAVFSTTTPALGQGTTSTSHPAEEEDDYAVLVSIAGMLYDGDSSDEEACMLVHCSE